MRRNIWEGYIRNPSDRYVTAATGVGTEAYLTNDEFDRVVDALELKLDEFRLAADLFAIEMRAYEAADDSVAPHPTPGFVGETASTLKAVTGRDDTILFAGRVCTDFVRVIGLL